MVAAQHVCKMWWACDPCSEASADEFAGQLDLGVHPVPTCTAMFSGALNTEANIDALLGSLGPNTPLGSEPLPTPAPPLNGLNGFNGFNGYNSSNKGLINVPPPPPPPSTTCASLYVKNLPPETDRLWLYERYPFQGPLAPNPKGQLLSPH